MKSCTFQAISSYTDLANQISFFGHQSQSLIFTSDRVKKGSGDENDKKPDEDTSGMSKRWVVNAFRLGFAFILIKLE